MRENVRNFRVFRCITKSGLRIFVAIFLVQILRVLGNIFVPSISAGEQKGTFFSSDLKLRLQQGVAIKPPPGEVDGLPEGLPGHVPEVDAEGGGEGAVEDGPEGGGHGGAAGGGGQVPHEAA